MDSEYALEARDIVKVFPGVRALDGVGLRVRRGEVHALVGENGAGKSTLMLTLSGIYKPDEGQILLDGRSVVFDSPLDAAHKGIGIVFQELSLVPSLSIAENVFANRQPIGRMGFVNRTELRRKTSGLLALFELDCLDPDLLVRDLPIAQQQVVEILKAISHDPSVLIFDEPTSSLTEMEIRDLFRNIKILKNRGIACIYISHHLHEIFQIADTVTVLRDGRYVCDARVSEINEDFLVSRMVGRTIVDMYGKRREGSVIGKERVRVEGLCRTGAFADVSFTIKAGEIVAFAGLVGAGRTEVGRAIFGAEPPDRGSIFLDGLPVKPHSPREAIALGIGYLSEDRKSQGLYLDFSVRMNLAANRLGDFCAGTPFIKDALTEDWARHAIDGYRIATPDSERPVKNLSGGNQQKVLAAEWIGIGPKLLIVDEPTRGVDVGAKSEIYTLLRNLAAEGAALMLISSDLNEVLGLADRIVVMKGGGVAGILDRSEATEEGVVALAAGVVQGVCIT
ncbi:MAG: sugar ABC transporter ATP-binding protein [Clostridia bacterium]|jgi:ABC-type sugar transport system ATPase subunit